MALSEGKQNLTNLLRAGGYSDNVSTYSSILADSSVEVQRRVCALKKYQLESIKLESKFYSRVHELEAEFEPSFNEVYEKRNKVVNGEHEPTDSECDLPLIHGLKPDELTKLKKDAPVETKPSKGIPSFWFHVLSNSSQINDMIFDQDIPILYYLTNITTEVHKEPPGFSLYFHFSENPYFTNKVLKKYYELSLFYEKDDPFVYDGPRVIKTEGTFINWNEEKNVTQKIVKKKQKKGSAAGRFITKMVSNESFFNFFDPSLKELSAEDDAENQDLLRADFEAGQLIRDQIIPRAVLFFTGEAADEDDFYGEDEESEDDQGDDEE